MFMLTNYLQIQESHEIRALEITYEKSCSRLDTVHYDERSRRLRVQNLLLEAECDYLQEHLDQKNEFMNDLEMHVQELQDDIEVTAGRLESAQGNVRIKAREVETLKAELNSLQGVTMDSTKLLTEKLTLARELSSLKPEIDHLRSQGASHQYLLAENMSLQRRVSMLQVELENDKRSIKRTTAKDSKLEEEAAELKDLVEKLRGDLSKERRERQRVEREAHKTLAEREDRVSTLESQLDALRYELRISKEQLKDTNSELQRACASTSRPSNLDASSARIPNPRKRAASRMDDDTMIDTPGDMPAAKQSKRGSAKVGEKSTFSTTPFLNRTARVAPSRPLSAGPRRRDTEVTESSIPAKCGFSHTRTPSEDTAEGADIQLRDDEESLRGAKPDVLELVTMAKLNSKAVPARKPKAGPRLEQVLEEGSNQDVVGAAPNSVEEKETSDASMVAGIQRKKTKRKILSGNVGKTLFDDNDDGNAPRGKRGTSSCAKSFPLWPSNILQSQPSSSSSKRWQTRQNKDRFALDAKVRGLKSRAAFKLLEVSCTDGATTHHTEIWHQINEKYGIFKNGQTVVDLGYAPGSWSQVAVDRTYPNGRVLGIDIIPAQPPKGVSTIQGNFLSLSVQEEVKKFLRESDRGWAKQELSLSAALNDEQMTADDLREGSMTHFEADKRAESFATTAGITGSDSEHVSHMEKDVLEGRPVDVVLSDMSEPWAQTDGFWKRSLSDPYYRMMNTSGMRFRDHAGSMVQNMSNEYFQDLCNSALSFASDTLRTEGHLVCKFYQGSEDKALERRLKGMFAKVHREKPESSRGESREAYFVALRRMADSRLEDNFKQT
ncbi:MAG: hypothetical protein Q9217_002870 [Psora testacea]